MQIASEADCVRYSFTAYTVVNQSEFTTRTHFCRMYLIHIATHIDIVQSLNLSHLIFLILITCISLHSLFLSLFVFFFDLIKFILSYCRVWKVCFVPVLSLDICAKFGLILYVVDVADHSRFVAETKRVSRKIITY